jgi:multiple sugar transport system substrate-binding protein
MMGQVTKLDRRDFLRLAAATATGAVLASCQPAATPPPPAAKEEAAPEVEEGAEVEAKPAEKVTITLLDWAAAEDVKAAEQALEKFEEEHPNIDVVYNPRAVDWIDKLLASMVAGNAADIFQGWGGVFHNFAERDQILDIQPYVDEHMTEEDLARFNPMQWHGMIQFGARIGVPNYINLMVLWWNVDLFDEYKVDHPETDWDHDDYREMCVALSQDTNGDGKVDLWGGWIPTWHWGRYWAHVRAFGGYVVNPEDNKDCMLDEPPAQEGLEWMRGVMWDDNAIAQALQVEQEWPGTIFPAQRVATAEDGCYPKAMSEDIEGQFKWSLAHIPQGPDRRSGLITTDGWAIWKGTPHPDAAWEVLEWRTQEYYQEKVIVRNAGRLPSNTNLITRWMEILRDETPALEDVRLETAMEALEMNYHEHHPYFRHHTRAKEMITAALEKIYIVGDTPVSYFGDVCTEIEEVQQKEKVA